MAENGNERYLRYILLLGEGVLLVLRGVVRREVQRTGSTLDAILTIPNNRRQMERNCHSETQRLHLFPYPTTVNSDIETWDISLLTLVLQRLFWSNLKRDERLQISYLRDNRNEYQGHPPAMSMEETEYTTRSADLVTTLQDLASGLDQQTRDTLTRIINDSNAVQFDFHTAIQHLQQLYEFKEEMLRELENKFQDVNTKLDTIQARVKRIQELQIRHWKQNTENELKTIIEAKCDHKEKEKKALDVLFDFVKMIQNQNDFTEQEIKHNIEQRIRWHGDICLQLIDDLLLWFSDMYNIPNAIPGPAQEGSIRIPIKCSSLEGLLKQMEYMDSANSKERLSEISYSLSKIIDSTCSLSWTIVPASLQKVMVTLSKDLETSHLSVESGKIVLPFQSKSLNGLSNIWSMFEGEEVNDHLARASKTLSKIVGADITLTTSVVKDQFTNAVYKMNKGVDSQSFETLKKPFEYLQGDEKTIYDDESKPFKMRTDKVFCFSDDVETKKKEEEFKSDRFPKRLSGEGSALRTESSTGSEKDYERHLKLKHVGEYSVRCEEDRGTPVISEIEVLPNGRILLTDWWNRNLKMLDSSFNVVSYCDLPGMPSCVSYIGKDTAAVGFCDARIVFVRVSGDIEIEKRLLKLDCVSYVESLAFYGETIYICDNAGPVYTSTTDGHLQRVLYKTQVQLIFLWASVLPLVMTAK
ncbi:uncharacterized protein LOC123540372 isoform X2 [Mercenaria mercenaria]|uniref:uncharacterized protein LOC123540372 isoform X2 n=1 Tax=Mercenaria mercenaria TaxID=6596 RepID=UPI00234EFC92|nr:uncharacterized protein LOC123540372 isoform X2 [Mercenaria mercenaria]